jgi:PAS domain S-box-containing protein
MPTPRHLLASAAADTRRTIIEIVGPLLPRVSAALALAGLLYVGLLAPRLPWSQLWPSAVLALAFAAALGVVALLGRRQRVTLALHGVLALACLAVAGFVWAGPPGVHAAAVGVLALVIAAAGALLGLRAALGYTALAAAVVLGPVLAERAGLLPAAAQGMSAPPDGLRPYAHGALLVAGLLTGWLLHRVFVSALAAAQVERARLRALFGIAADWYWEQDEQFRFTYISPGAGSLGLPSERYLGRTRWEMAEPGLTEAQWAAHRADLQARRPFRDLVLRRVGPQGRPLYTAISGEPQLDDQGRFRGYWGVGRDVTAEHEAQRAIERSERLFRELFDISPSPFIVHRRGAVVLANKAAARLFGFAAPAAMVGHAMTALNRPESRELSAARIAAMESMPVGGSVPTAELAMQTVGGELRHVQALMVRIELIDGPASMSVYFDLSERRAVEQRLRSSEQMLMRLVEANPDYVTVSRLRDSRLELVNAGFERVTGLARAQVIGRGALELGIWHDPAERVRLLQAVQERGIAHDVPASLRHVDGSLRSVLFSAAPFEMAGERYLVATARDVTAKETERLQYEALLANASVGIAFTRDRRFELANPVFESMFGWARGALDGQPGAVVWPTAADYAEVSRIAGPPLARGEPIDIERPMRRRDGSTFWCRLLARAVDPQQPSAGGTIWIAEDVTERRAIQRALAAAKEQAEAASQAKSAFLANTSHEIRTPLNGLLGLARLALDARTDAGRTREYLKLILESAETLSLIISDILDLSKIEAGKLTLERADFDLHALLHSVHAAHRELAAAKGLPLQLDIAAGVPPRVNGDAVRVRQIIGNFVSNALKFTAHGRIELRAQPAGGGLRLTVSDTGIGLAPELLARLFEPFTQADESTTRRYGGTGLGLSICRQLARLMGGEVGVDSAVGRGSSFWAELPLAPASAAAAPADGPTAEAQPLAGLRVLLVEDNAVNMLIADSFLANWGAQVLQATDGRQALEAVEREGGRIDVVLLDMHMPVMSGYEALAELRRRHSASALPVIALTAAALSSERDRCLALGANGFVTKPIDAQRLCETVRRCAAART